MLLAAVGIGAVGVVQMSVEPRADAVSIGTISAQMSNQQGITETGDPDGTNESNCIRYAPPNDSTSSQFVTSPGEALTAHGRDGGSCPSSLDVDEQSALGVKPAVGSTILNGDPFLLARVIHYNNPVIVDAEYFRGDMSLKFGDFDGTPTVTFPWRMWETPNAGPCPNGGGPSGCDDETIFTDQISDVPLSQDGIDYLLVIDGFVPVNSEDACPATPTVPAENDFWTDENSTTHACLYGSIYQERPVTIVKEIQGVTEEVVAPSETFIIDSEGDLTGSPWDTSFELTPPADGFDSADPVSIIGRDTATLTEESMMDSRWELTDIECTDFDAEGEPRLLPKGATYDVENGQLILSEVPAPDYEDDGSITCTFTNTYTPMTTLTLVKVVEDGDATVKDFTLTATGVDGTPTEEVVVSGISGSDDVTEVMVPAGEYVLSEDGTEGYLSPNGWDCGEAEMDGDSVMVEDDEEVVCTIVNELEREEISLAKVPSPEWFSAAGQAITYTYTISNSGNLPLGPGQFTVTDDRLDEGVAFNCGAATVELDPDETVSCTRTYTSTAADVTAGEIVNEAFASLDELDSETVMATVDYAVLLIAKSPSPTQVTAAGQSVTYTYTLTNNGAEPLGPDQFTVTDDKINSGTAFNCGPAATTLAVAGTVSCTAAYTVTAADITAGSIVNKASASGGGVTSPMVSATVTVVSPPVVPPIFVPSPGTPVLPAATPSLNLTKTASPDTFFATGEVITYTYTILNDGDTAIGPTQFTITDNKINGGQPFNCGPATKIISVNLNQMCTAYYTITEADMAAGFVTNTAFASGGTVDSNTATATVNKVTLIFPAEIPVTGSMSMTVLGFGLVTLGLGLGAMLLVRRRRLV
ncbi:MAG: choice-of-anchor K domain-containing protein [Actinomycetota bacterium]|nr:choice-of-anchor K domain-containing protein [Actinomycetota bacterium]